jgi:predicted lactoylglutathione lyase
MIVNEHTNVMLLAEPHFRSFTDGRHSSSSTRSAMTIGSITWDP